MESSDAAAPHTEAGDLLAEATPKARANYRGRVVHVGIALKPSTAMGRLSAELSGAWNFKPYWGKPAVRNFRGGGWRRDHGSRTEAHAERSGTATGPYRARASAPPDRRRRATRPPEG